MIFKGNQLNEKQDFSIEILKAKSFHLLENLISNI